MRVSDYINSIKTTAQSLGFFRAIWGVFYARAFYKIGPFYYSVFRLSDVSSSDWPNYIDSTESNRFTGAINKKKNYYLARNKLEFHRHCHENNIPTIPILSVIESQKEEERSAFINVISSNPADLFFKLSDGSHGEGAFKADYKGEGIWLIGRETYNISELYDFARSKAFGGAVYLVQAAIKPHDALIPIMPDGALGTVRVITYLEGTEARAILPVLRIPANGNVTDNFSLGLQGNLVAPIDVQTGALGVARTSRNRHWPDIIQTSTHPNSGELIEGRLMPFWKETLDMVLNAQRQTSQLPTLGWDIAITNEGPLVVETNTHYASELHQIAYERGIRQDLAPAFSMRDTQD